MIITVMYQDSDTNRIVIENMDLTYQSENELQSILNSFRVAQCSKENADQAVLNGALDLRPYVLTTK